ncbi:hypothetical protein OAU50_01630 [Planctomycetota bacterium]|nr:hypothetical protein [Planctomycetota bacterium]
MADVWNAYRGHQFETADGLINAQLADEFDLSEQEARSLGKNPVHGKFKPDTPEEALLLLEKSMILLAKGDTKNAEKLLLRARDAYDKAFLSANFSDFADSVGAAMSDDTSLEYDPAPYEHVMLRCALVMLDLMNGGKNAQAYAHQIDDTQRRILGYEFVESGEAYTPYENYKNVGFGAYMRGVILENKLKQSSAVKAYEKFAEYEPDMAFAKKSVERAKSGEYAPEGCGVVHIMYLGGKGPTLESSDSPVTQAALALAAVIGGLMTDYWSPAAQNAISEVPVPKVVINTRSVSPLEVTAGGRSYRTQTVLDVNKMAVQHLDSQMSGIIARAIIRRVVKAAIAATAEAAAKEANDGGWAQLGVAIGGAIWTAVEVADTRSWGLLPAQVQTVRIPLPAGVHDLKLGDGSTVAVEVTKGYDSFVTVTRPNQKLKAAVSVDEHSKPRETGARVVE